MLRISGGSEKKLVRALAASMSGNLSRQISRETEDEHSSMSLLFLDTSSILMCYMVCELLERGDLHVRVLFAQLNDGEVA